MVLRFVNTGVWFLKIHNDSKLFNFFLQSATDQLSVSFKYSDKESGVDHFKVQIYEVAGGTRRQKYPGWFFEIWGSSNQYIYRLLNHFIQI